MRPAVLAALVCAAPGCGSQPAPPPSWEIVHQDLPEALLSVWGTAEDDVWAVGADDGDGPLVLHYDGVDWQTLDTGASGDLWWAHGFAGGPVFFSGAGGLILRYQDGSFTPMTTPGGGIVFGVWGSDPEAMWAVGGAAGGASGAFAWRLQGDAWVAAADFPGDLVNTDALWKVSGRSADDVWMVGTRGAAVHWDGNAFTEARIDTSASLFTVHANDERFVAVGGVARATIFENDGSGWRDVSPSGDDLPGMIGVRLGTGDAYAVGQSGEILLRTPQGWQHQPTDLYVPEALHAVWIDPEGGVWAVGGQVQAWPLVRGVMVSRSGT